MKDISIRTFANRKAVIVYVDGESVLFSYDTKIATRKKNGELVRHCDEYALSMTTIRHLHEFAPEIHKKDFLKLPLKK